MQWTMRELLDRIAELDLQISSYLERVIAKSSRLEDEHMAVMNWVQAHTTIMTILLREIGDRNRALDAEIEAEQRAVMSVAKPAGLLPSGEGQGKAA